MQVENSFLDANVLFYLFLSKQELPDNYFSFLVHLESHAFDMDLQEVLDA